MSTIYCNTVGCKKQALYTKHQRHFCEACLRSYDEGKKTAQTGGDF